MKYSSEMLNLPRSGDQYYRYTYWRDKLKELFKFYPVERISVRRLLLTIRRILTLAHIVNGYISPEDRDWINDFLNRAEHRMADIVNRYGFELIQQRCPWRWEEHACLLTESVCSYNTCPLLRVSEILKYVE